MTEAVSILQTGTIRIRPSQRTQSASRPVALRRLKVLLGDRSWTEPLPINTYLIDHPDGPILFDAGESPHVTDKGWFPWWQPFFHHADGLKDLKGARILVSEEHWDFYRKPLSSRLCYFLRTTRTLLAALPSERSTCHRQPCRPRRC